MICFIYLTKQIETKKFWCTQVEGLPSVTHDSMDVRPISLTHSFFYTYRITCLSLPCPPKLAKR